jgi:hypothetical protein
MNSKQSIVTSFAIAALLVAGSGLAQVERIAPGPQVPCPYPISQIIKGNATPPSADPSDLPPGTNVAGSAWNQTAVNQHFGHTFRFPTKDCCAYTRGTLIVTVKALQGGPRGSATSANDSVYVFSGPTRVGEQQPWLSGVTTGATTTLTFNIPQNILNNGHLTLYVQDDTAVVSADLRLEGCCIRK